MQSVNVSQLRGQLPKYFERVMAGGEIVVTSHGRPIARIVPIIDVHEEAKRRLSSLRETCQVGDVVTSLTDLSWNADQ